MKTIGRDTTFPSADGLLIHATIYKAADSLPWILLCHQARYSRGEFIEIAPKLNALGFNCIAIDARSGDGVNGIVNETAKEAKAAGKATDYIAAKPDIEAAMRYAYNLEHTPIILFGSSYSASLALIEASETPKIIRAVIAFSPGEYFEDPNLLHRSITTLSVPTFVTSSLAESEEVAQLFADRLFPNLTRFVPKGDGVHAASCLWSSTKNHEEYWAALGSFLKKLK